jgi:methylmalonyl-CoA mutase N-terminal domain/subunit
VNAFTNEADEGQAGVAVFRVDPQLERCQIDRVRALRAGRDAGACSRALAAVTEAAVSGANLMPPIIAAVEAKATVGEISDVMRSVFGEHVSDA